VTLRASLVGKARRANEVVRQLQRPCAAEAAHRCRQRFRRVATGIRDRTEQLERRAWRELNAFEGVEPKHAARAADVDARRSCRLPL
jgi:hypothetical protein